MSPKVEDIVWVRRKVGANPRKLVSARVVFISKTAILPYRLRFADGSENSYHGSELVDIKETQR